MMTAVHVPIPIQRLVINFIWIASAVELNIETNIPRSTTLHYHLHIPTAMQARGLESIHPVEKRFEHKKH